MTTPIRVTPRRRIVPSAFVGALALILAAQASRAQDVAPEGAPKATAQGPKKRKPTTPAARAATQAPAATDPAVEAAALLEQIRRERAELEAAQATTTRLIRLMVEEGVITRDRAEQLLPERQRGTLADVEVRPSAASPAAAAATPAAAPEPAPAPAPGVVRVPYIPETVRLQMEERIRQDVLAQAKTERWGDPGTLPAWLSRLSFSGDLRLRYQGEYYGADNTDAATYYAVTGALRDGQPIANTQTNVDGFRFRFRYGFTAQVSESFSVAARLATGRTPVSANPRLGQYGDPDGFRLVVDRAAIVWQPNTAVTVQGGRIGNPWFWPTDLLWYEDLNFDGGSVTVRPAIGPRAAGFFTVGAFQMQLIDPTTIVPAPKDKYMLGTQAGAEWTPDRNLGLKVGLGYFHYSNMEGRRNTLADPTGNNWTAPPFRQKGNTVFDINAGTGQAPVLALASRFHIVNASMQLDLGHFDPLHLRITADYAKNIGFDQGEIRERTGLNITPKTSAYQTMFTVGNPDVWGRGNTSVFLGYRYVEPDAVVDAFTQANVLLGGTNAKGYMLGINYGLDTDVWLRWRWLSANAIQGPPLAIDVLQGDLMLRF